MEWSAYVGPKQRAVTAAVAAAGSVLADDGSLQAACHPQEEAPRAGWAGTEDSRNAARNSAAVQGWWPPQGACAEGRRVWEGAHVARGWQSCWIAPAALLHPAHGAAAVARIIDVGSVVGMQCDSLLDYLQRAVYQVCSLVLTVQPIQVASYRHACWRQVTKGQTACRSGCQGHGDPASRCQAAMDMHTTRVSGHTQTEACLRQGLDWGAGSCCPACGHSCWEGMCPQVGIL